MPMHKFLLNNREDLIARCSAKVAERPSRWATEKQLINGIPMFLDQLIRTLAAEKDHEGQGDGAISLIISGPSGGSNVMMSEMGVSAIAHGKQLLVLGYSVDQVVHDYGDLCQAITDLAFERDVPFEVVEFRTLNRCLDNAIAAAVSEFTHERDFQRRALHEFDIHERAAYLAADLRVRLEAVNYAVRALELGNMWVGGATGAVLKRNLASLSKLIDESEEVQS